MNRLVMKPCPFCGEEPTMQPWHGGLPTKKLITCSNAGFEDENDGCSVGPSVSGETEEEAVTRWNRRAVGISVELQNVKRFDYATIHKCGQQPRGIMIEAAEGEYVQFNDFTEITSQFLRIGHEDGVAQSAADKIIGEIEARFPNWKSYRNLIDCIDVTLHDLRSTVEALSKGGAA